MEQVTLWDHLPLLVRANSIDSVESILQTLWRTRKTGVDAADRATICDLLQLENDSDLDPLLACLRMLMRKCVYDKINNDEIERLFPGEVLPEIQRLLTLLLQKFRNEWLEDVLKEQVTLPRLRSVSSDRINTGSSEPVSISNLKFQNEVKFDLGETELNFQLTKHNLEATAKSVYSVQDKFSEVAEQSIRHVHQDNSS